MLSRGSISPSVSLPRVQAWIVVAKEFRMPPKSQQSGLIYAVLWRIVDVAIFPIATQQAESPSWIHLLDLIDNLHRVRD